MALSLTAALSAAAPTLLGFGAQGLFSAAAAERERAWSEKMYNKYNSPAALVRQYQEAGINPALMFGQSAIPAPTTSSMAAMPENPAGGFVEMLGSLMQLELLDEQKRGLQLENNSKEFELGLRQKYGDTLTSNDVHEGLARIRKLKSEASLNEFEFKFIKPIEMLLMQRQSRGIELDNLEKEAARAWYLAYGRYPGASILEDMLGMIGRIFYGLGVEGTPLSISEHRGGSR